MYTPKLTRSCNDVECTSLLNFWAALHNLFVTNYSEEYHRNFYYSSHVNCAVLKLTLKLNTDSNL